VLEALTWTNNHAGSIQAGIAKAAAAAGTREEALLPNLGYLKLSSHVARPNFDCALTERLLRSKFWVALLSFIDSTVERPGVPPGSKIKKALSSLNNSQVDFGRFSRTRRQTPFNEFATRLNTNNDESMSQSEHYSPVAKTTKD
jgi:hypothetical protein